MPNLVKNIDEIQPVTLRHIHENPVLDRIFRNRGISTPEELSYQLDYRLTGLLSPFSLKGINEACDIIIEHIMSKSKILIISDFDCDGAGGGAVGVQGLRMLGASDVDFLVPDRSKHGYGLTPAIVEAAEKRRPDLIITVDSGISSFDGAEAVKRLSKRTNLIITDHHLPPKGGMLPAADAIVNPNQQGCEFESKNICGCGVMFYLLMALRVRMREESLFSSIGVVEPDLRVLLDVVAMSTVADLVPLDRNNRIIVSAGLKLINSGRARPSINALLQIGKREIGKITASDIGFCLGPRINAAGRLDDMTIGVSALLDYDQVTSIEKAKILDDINSQRKNVEADISVEAFAEAEMLDRHMFSLCVYNPSWHEGVVGIVASRIKEKFNKPSICFTSTHELREIQKKLAKIPPDKIDSATKEALENAYVKGSARSVPGVHLKHTLDAILKCNLEFGFGGGHAMACGVSIKYKYLSDWMKAFDDEIRKCLTQEMINGDIKVDIKDLPSAYITLENAELIRFLGPWGQRFDEPLFSGRFFVISQKILKEKHIKFKLRHMDGMGEFDAIAFNCVKDGCSQAVTLIEASFKLEVNDFKGKRAVQLLINHYQDKSHLE